MTFGETIRSARESRGLSQQSVADHLGVSNTYVSDLERGARNMLDVGRIAALAEVLGLDATELVWSAVESWNPRLVVMLKGGSDGR